MSKYKKTVEKLDHWNAPDGYELHGTMPHPANRGWTICIWQKPQRTVVVHNRQSKANLKGSWWANNSHAGPPTEGGGIVCEDNDKA